MAQPSRRFSWRKKKQPKAQAPIVAEEAGFGADFVVDRLDAMCEDQIVETAYLPARGSVPIRVRLYDDADPAPGAPEWLWLDPKLLPADVEGAKVVAHRLSEEDAGHIGDLVAGDVVIVSRGFDDPPDPEQIYLVTSSPENADEAGTSSTRLSRVRIKGSQLILISEGARTDVEIIDLSQQRALSYWLLGKVVLVIRRAPGVEFPA